MQQTLERARRGDIESYTVLFLKHSKSLQHYLALRLGEETEEALQECYLAAWRGLSRFDMRRDFRAWLFGVARNIAKRMVSARRRHLPLEPETASVRPPERSGAQEVLAAALDELNDADRALLMMRHAESSTSADIARSLDTTPGAVRARLSRLYAKLRQRMGRILEGESR
jgi:RNA polymerase sigma-70 factor (ECF subfamily)